LIEVPKELAERSRDVARGLVVHDRMNKAAGQPFHFAAHAAVAARPMIGEQAFKRAKSDLKKANEAKHVWADSGDDAVVSHPSPSAHTSPQAPRPSSRVDMQTQTDDMPTFGYQPALDGKPSTQLDHSTFCGLGDGSQVFLNPLPLFEAQNNTIALLAGRLDAMVQSAPAQKRLRELERRIQSLSGDVDTLRKSMATSIDDKLAKALPRLVPPDAASMPDITSALQEMHDKLQRVIAEGLALRPASADTVVPKPPVAAPPVAAAVPQVAEQVPVPVATPIACQPDPGDIVRLTGLSSTQFNNKIAKVLSHAKGDARARVQVLPLGPSIRVLPERMSFPARCRLCDERIHGLVCGACDTPAGCDGKPCEEFPPDPDLLPSPVDAHDGDPLQLLINHATDVDVPNMCSPPSSGASSPRGGTHQSRASPPPASRRANNARTSARPSSAELDRRAAAVCWSA